MRQFILLLCFLPSLAWTASYKVITFKAPANYTLSPTETQLLCKSLYGQLTTEALNKIERLVATPYSCQLDTDQKTLVIKFTLK